MDPGVVTDPGVVAGYLAAERIDYVKVVPSHLAALGAAGGLAGLMPGRALVLGGEGAGAAWVGEVLAAAAGRGCVVANHYGPTESTIGVVAGVLAAGDVAGGVVALGRPVAEYPGVCAGRVAAAGAGGGGGGVVCGGVRSWRGGMWGGRG